MTPSFGRAAVVVLLTLMMMTALFIVMVAAFVFPLPFVHEACPSARDTKAQLSSLAARGASFVDALREFPIGRGPRE